MTTVLPLGLARSIRSGGLGHLEMLRAMVDMVSELGDLVGYCAGLVGFSIGADWAFDLAMKSTHNGLLGLLYVLAIP